jgi:hypothetical protein
MPLYNATSSDGSTWYAATQVVIDNPHDAPPTATFREVVRYAVDGALVGEKGTGRQLSITVGALPRSFPIVDPVTDEPIPGQSITDHEIGLFLRSVYLALAREADAATPAE